MSIVDICWSFPEPRHPLLIPRIISRKLLPVPKLPEPRCHLALSTSSLSQSFTFKTHQTDLRKKIQLREFISNYLYSIHFPFKVSSSFRSDLLSFNTNPSPDSKLIKFSLSSVSSRTRPTKQMIDLINYFMIWSLFWRVMKAFSG